MSVRILQVRCSLCGEKVDEYYDSDSVEWWVAFMNPKEHEVCLYCMLKRRGFARAFKQNTGVNVKTYIEKIKSGRFVELSL